jgi:hypothetical protein
MTASAQTFDYYHKWLGIPPPEQPPNHYRLLGIANFEADPDVIETAAEQRMMHIRARQTGKHATISQKLLNEIAAARVLLLEPDQKKEYDAGLRDKLIAASRPEDTPNLPGTMVPSAETLAPVFVVPPQETAGATAKESRFPTQAAIAVGTVGVLLIVGVLIALPLLLGQPSNTTAEVQSSVPAVSTAPQPPPRPQPETTPTLQAPPVQPTPAREPVNQATEALPAEIATELQPLEAPPEPASPAVADEPQIALATEPMPEPPQSENPPAEVNAAETADQRLPVPDTASLEQARQTVKEIYADQFAAAKQPEQKAEIANEILSQAQMTLDDAAGKYVLLDTARRVGEQAGDLGLTLRAVDELAKSYEVNALPLKESALEACRKLTRQTNDWQRLAEASLAIVDEALTAGDYEAADRIAELSLECARKSRDKDLIIRVATRAKEVNQLSVAYARAKDAFERLKADPQDAASHVIVGKFLCFDKRDWPAGLPHLVQGSDLELSALAKQDLDAAFKSGTWTELADQWLEHSKSAQNPEREAAEERAAYWYRQALPTLTGLARIKVEKSLETLPNPAVSASKQAESATEITSTEPSARGLRRRGTPATPPRPELGLVGKWTMTYESGGVRHYVFDGKGFASFIEERRIGRLHMKGNDVVLEFDDGKLERLRLMDGMLLVDHYDPASRYPDAPTSRGRLEPTQ